MPRKKIVKKKDTVTVPVVEEKPVKAIPTPKQRPPKPTIKTIEVKKDEACKNCKWSFNDMYLRCRYYPAPFPMVENDDYCSKFESKS